MTIKSCSNLAPGKQKLLFAKQTALRLLTDVQVRTWSVLSKPAGTLPPDTPLYLSGCSHPLSCGI